MSVGGSFFSFSCMLTCVQDMRELLGDNPIRSAARVVKADFNGALLKGTSR